jgi:rod shape-determining protein MreD
VTAQEVERLSMNTGRIFASLTPALIAVLAVAIANLPVSFSNGILPPPLLGLTVIYFWTLLRPDLVPPVLVLVIGLFEDLLSGGQPGLWALGYLVAYAITDRQRDAFAGLAGWGVMIGFSVVMVSTAALVYVVGSLIYWRFAPLQPLLIQAIVTVILYPLMAFILGLFHRRFVGAPHGED